MYNIYSKKGEFIKGGFPTYKAAFTHLIMNQRYDWIIKFKRSNYGN